MTSPANRRADTILGILREARDAGINRLSKTTLIKFIYLLDVFVAEETDGVERWTDLPWRFLHFGPFAPEAVDTLTALETKAFLEIEEGDREGKDFVLYRLSDVVRAPSLEAIGVPGEPRRRLQQAIRDYAFALPRLLNYVYLRTTPMEFAFPGDDLSFVNCRKLRYKDDIRPLKLKRPSSEAEARLRDLFGKMEARHSGRSNDNAFSEAQFKTLKYQTDFPGRFRDAEHARGWCAEFFEWYNHHHQHSGLALFTPADVFYGRIEELIATRQAGLDAAYAAHPERFVHGPPRVQRPPAVVAINPLQPETVLSSASAVLAENPAPSLLEAIAT
jgi:hypothetical protein